MTGSEANTGAMSAVAESHEKVRLQCALSWRGVGQPETARYVRRNNSEMLQIKGWRMNVRITSRSGGVSVAMAAMAPNMHMTSNNSMISAASELKILATVAHRRPESEPVSFPSAANLCQVATSTMG